MQYHLVYDESLKEYVEEELLPLLGSMCKSHASLKETDFSKLEQSDFFFAYLSDNQIKASIEKIKDNKLTVAILPHPDAKEACTGFGIHYNIEKAIDFYKKEHEPIDIDLLFSNNRPLFNSLIIGDTFQLTTSKFSKSQGKLKQVITFFKKLFSIKPFFIDIEMNDDKTLKTAASGVVVVQHKKSLLLSKLILEDSSINDGMFHAFVISPRSLMQLFLFSFKSLRNQNTLPDFGAHIRTNKLKFINEDTGLEFSEDGNSMSAKEIVLEVKEKQLKILPGEFLEHEKSSSNNSIYKTAALPFGEVANELVEKKLPFIRYASTDEFKDLFTILRGNARLKNTYLMLMILSTILATFGLFGNSSPVIIGAMILAPLMAPVISLSMATLRQNNQLAIQSLKTIAVGMGVSFLFGYVITLITPLNFPNQEILARTRPNILDLGIAVVSGVAGAYAHAREEVAKTLAGVAIAVALVPPLAVSAIGLGWLDMQIFLGSLLLLLTNLVGMVLAGALTFAVLGFSPIKRAPKSLLITLIAVLILSVPLGFGFKQMVEEHAIIKQLDGWETSIAKVKNVNIQRFKPLTISIKLVSTKPLSEFDIENIKIEIEEKLEKPVSLEVSTALKK